ncbi:hypothetical protein KFU94_04825 [Chloroflexi bacterium TSY]|nr:hypothetical protein [Chloroflexi bacterium TSY]
MANRTTIGRGLPIPWEQVQGAVWLIGLAIIAWQGWWWPGILVLVAISALVQGVVETVQKQQKAERKLEKERSIALPDQCPNCGSPTNAENVKWTSKTAADCSFCGTQLPTTSGKAIPK